MYKDIMNLERGLFLRNIPTRVGKANVVCTYMLESGNIPTRMGEILINPRSARQSTAL